MLQPVRPVIVVVHAGAVPLPRGVEVRGFDDAAQVAGALGIAAGLAVPAAGPPVLPARWVQVLECLELVVAHSRDLLQGRVPLPPAVAASEGDGVAADLAHQVSQQGRRQPFPVRQVGTVLANDGRQGAQIPFAGHRGRHHETPRDHFTPAVPAWPSAEHRIAAVNTGRTHWHPGRKHADESETAMAGKAVISLSTGLEDPEKVAVAFLVAVGAAESGRPTLMFQTKEAVRLALDGVAVGVACDGCPALPDLLARYQKSGGRYMVCPVCFNAKQLDKGSLLPNAELAGTVQLWEWIGDEGATTFSY